MKELTVLINNLEFYYKVAGQGRPFFVLHGWGSSSIKWEKISEILANNGFMVFTFDLPGFGKNENFLTHSWGLDDYSGFLEELIRSLSLTNFYLLGHSFGGTIAVKYSTRNSEKVKKLFLVAASCIRKKTFKKKILEKTSKFLKLFSFLPFWAGLRKRFYASVLKSDYPVEEGVLKETYLRVIKEDLSQELNLVRVKTIIIWGDKDKITPLLEAITIKKSILNSELKIIKGGNHSFYLEYPEKLIEIILTEK